ncbi:MAG: M48 family metallopeptidase [Thiovulaceae bacterium]|nr:M48 family metallopeptidase [Sulfurimonadaceae bacterium]
MLKTPIVSSFYINNLLSQKQKWIEKKLLEIENRIYVDKNIPDEKIAKKFLASRVDYFSKMMNLDFSELKFRKMKRRWGSCDSKKRITLNTYLYNTSKEQIDYVVVHELAHLVHMNHSKEFHSLVDNYIAHSKSIRQQFYIL